MHIQLQRTYQKELISDFVFLSSAPTQEVYEQIRKYIKFEIERNSAVIATGDENVIDKTVQAIADNITNRFHEDCRVVQPRAVLNVNYLV